ncbi:hypothetical protein RJ639_031409 [Escallonia herrerae]|uniref:O-fucosyltransferase family protein n=1 Tax=Escallonia herrerae TaxID=1293975 RepID=A0AA88X1T1_9ASTE|nr:hypothetical protein RJ639_031409 [Escallonia herrerae]
MKLQYMQCQSQRVALAGIFVILLPSFFPNLFAPLGRSYLSTFSEWNAPKPRHLPLLEGALHHQAVSSLKGCSLTSGLPCPTKDRNPVSTLLRSLVSSLNDALPKKSEGYIQVFLDGGLNQQRMGYLSSKICDAVAVAKILNATLVLPHLEVNPVWQDSSSFPDIFDVDHFINVLKDEVSIVQQLPNEYFWSTREYYATGIRAIRIKTAPSHASAHWYLENVLPVLQSYGIAAIAPFSHRLAFDNLPSDIQHLRCKVNFQALVFVPKIRMLGGVLVNRLRRSPDRNIAAGTKYLHERTGSVDKQEPGKFVVLHLRFDKDMAAHSACDFGGGKAEKVLNSQFTDEELRNQGRCPLTPEDIGLLLAALGFSNSTRPLYLASHKVYGGEARISTLRKLFPLMEDKKSLASADELAEVDGKASVLAAIDYYVSMQSDIFISASPGNMHNALVGHRAYINLKTIRPNMVLLGQLFLNRSMTWSEFQQAIQNGHKNRQGQERRSNPYIHILLLIACVELNEYDRRL